MIIYDNLKLNIVKNMYEKYYLTTYNEEPRPYRRGIPALLKMKRYNEIIIETVRHVIKFDKK